MNARSTPHPATTEFQDCMELSNGRVWMLLLEDPASVEDVPRIVLDQFPDERAFDDLREDGKVWFHPEDLPQIIEKLSNWLDTYRQCAREDASGSLPHPNWGTLKWADE